MNEKIYMMEYEVGEKMPRYSFFVTAENSEAAIEIGNEIATKDYGASSKLVEFMTLGQFIDNINEFIIEI